ncbi:MULTISPECIES: RNA polymerase sigma factor [Paenibacillus]|uniref:RNA polymerase sigma factor n=1 Tax=Paenibacillus TaxID=44249 RepID=UPI0022B8D63E|nr:sigma-70 family RNA polymerase sigma factor [Paenibacillus caseinilyticus]MCZ8521174.1 sigma-70 family RNA polymerase sigma factor [Paenibacillus caseinilyticus]
MEQLGISEMEAQDMFREHAPYVYGIALMMTNSAAAADDLTQETFLRAFAKYKLYDPAKPLRPWLYRITVNLARSMHRKQRWLTFLGQVPETDSGNCVEDIMVRQESDLEVWQMVGTLSKKRREVIILFYYAGLPLPEVAATLGIRLGTCKSRLHAALQQLRGLDRTPLSQHPALVKEGFKSTQAIRMRRLPRGARRRRPGLPPGTWSRSLPPSPSRCCGSDISRAQGTGGRAVGTGRLGEQRWSSQEPPFCSAPLIRPLESAPR